MKKLKILVEMKHGLGDCICMLPALQIIRQNYPDAYIALIVNGKINKELFEHSRIKIDKYYYFSLKNRSKFYTLKVLYKLWREKFDIGVLATMTPASKGKGLFKLLGIKRCYGEQYKGIEEFSLDDKVHFVDRNIDVVRDFCTNVETISPQLFPDESHTDFKNSLFSNGKPKIAINIGGGDKNYYEGAYVYTRNWGAQNMRDLVRLVSQLKQYDVLLLGGPLEESLLEIYNEVLTEDNVYNFVNKTTIGETFYLIRKSEVSVGVDTGMQHAADALNIKTLSIFGPTNPKTHGAYSKKGQFIISDPKVDCQYCFGKNQYYTCQNRICLTNISPQMVFEQIKAILHKG